MSGDDWECQLGETDSSSSSTDSENVYGVNNLSYLKRQIKGYDADENHFELEGEEEEQNEDLSEINDSILVSTTKDNKTRFEFSSKIDHDLESSGDGDIDNNDDKLENKAGYGIPIPMNSDSSGLLSTHLQRLSQLIKSVNNEHNKTMELEPDDLNQFLALHKIKDAQQNAQKYGNFKPEPVPHNGLIDQNHLNQILELQNKLNNFAVTHDAFSTPPTPIQFVVSGNGAYPSDATTVHIKATNSLQASTSPESGHSTSQIIVNRPGGSVVFRLPNSNNIQHENERDKNSGQISEDTLKALLELSKNMANQASNTPNFVHDHPTPAPYVQPILQPILYNFPFPNYSLSTILSELANKKFQGYEENQSMEKISAVSGVVPTRSDTAAEPDDTGPTTIIHNHIPISISNPNHPNPTNKIVNRFQVVSTTARPTVSHDSYDSYGNSVSSDNSHHQYSYPPYQNDENTNKNAVIQPAAPTISTSLSAFSPGFPSHPYSTINYNHNANDQPQYIQIAQSRPDPYEPPRTTHSHSSVFSGVQRPIPTYASIDGGYTQKFYTPYTPSPHLNEHNVNHFVNLENKPYPTLQPVNYVPISSASNQNSNYIDTSATTYFSQQHKYHKQHKQQKYPTITDKIDHFDDDESEISENSEQNDFGESNANGDDDEYMNSNVEQNSNDDNNENVMNILANYNSKIKPSSSTNSDSGENKPIYQFKPAQTENHKQFVNLGGNFISLETFQDSIEPYLKGNSMLGSKIEVLTCATGVRQANVTDCTRYFVCNAKTGKVLSYSCPPYTAFNSDTKICNAETYSRCYPDSLKNRVSIPSGNTKYAQQQAHISMIEANRIKTEALKAQQLAQLIKIEADKMLNSNRYKIRYHNDGKSTTVPLAPTRPSNTIRRQPTRKNQHIAIQNKPVRQQQTTAVFHQPIKSTAATLQKQPSKKVQGKRKIPCKVEGKLSDQLSKYHYFLCFKDKEKKMRARRLQCPANLIFCANTLVCTSTQRCMNKFNRL